MGFAQGSPLPNVTETTTTAQSSPDYYKTHLEDLQSAGQTAMKRTGEESVAGYDPLQTLGYNAIPGAATSYQPGLSAAQQTANKAAAGITPGRIQSLMNPYTTNVVNEMSRLSQQNLERNLLPTMRSGFVGTGGLGSQRYANALGQSMSDIQSGLTGQQYGALSKGYSEALKGALDEAQLMNQAARTQGDLAKYEQDLGLTGAGALTKAGAERQAYAQSILDAPMKTAKAASDLMRGYTVPTTETKTFTGPRTRDYYQQSDMSKLLGGLTFARMAGQGLFGTQQAQAGLLSFLTGAAKNIDLGGGRSVKFDQKGNPVVSGGLEGTGLTAADFSGWGFVGDDEGNYVMPANINFSDWDAGQEDASAYWGGDNDSAAWDWALDEG
jgi:hypothetical protein